MSRLLAKFLVPHHANDHYPHAVRPNFLTFYLAAILTVQLVYNFVTTGEIKILSFATNIQQSQVVALTNSQRAAAGVGVLKENALLNQAAAQKAADMFSQNYWAHVAPNGTTPWYFFSNVGYKYLYAGENLAKDFDTSSSVVSGWMNSSSHKANLLSANYTDIGVAVVNGVLLGQETTLVVQLFGKPQFSSSLAQAPSGGTTTPKPAEPQPQGTGIEHEITPQPASPEEEVASNDPNPVIANPFVASPQEEVDVIYRPNVLSLEHLNGGQRMMLAILIPILAFFLFDAIVLLSRRRLAVRGSSLVHAAVVGVIIVTIMSTSFGVLR